MIAKRNGSAKNARSCKIVRPNGKDQMQFAKEQIMKGNATGVISILLDLLNTDCRLPASLELAYLFFQMKNYYLAEPYINIILNEESNKVIKSQVSRMKVYLEKLEQLNQKREFYGEYYERQMITYNKEEMLDYVTRERISKEQELTNSKILYLYEAEPLIEKVTPYITSRKGFHTYDALDEYWIFIPNIGIYENDMTSELKILTIRDSKEILDVFPVKEGTARKLIVPNPEIELPRKEF